jgi:hypothetical protein
VQEIITIVIIATDISAGSILGQLNNIAEQQAKVAKVSVIL